MTNAERRIRFAIVTCSDTRALTQDDAGYALEERIKAKGWDVANHVIVKDDVDQIAAAIVEAADGQKVDVVLTCGGSGLSPRDVTPEATRSVCDRDVPGIAEGMRAHSMAITPFAMLSRAVCMQRGTCIVINLPGSTKAATENWEAIEDVLPHAAAMMAREGH